MKKTLGITGLATLLMLAGGRAEALSLTPTSTTCTSTQNGLNLGEVYDLLHGCFGNTLPEGNFQQLYKSEVGGADSGAYASSYNTTYDLTTQNPSKATIDDVANPTIVCFECYLVVKGGKTSYYYDISGWNGTEAIVLTGWTGPTYGAISNVVIYGVPEPATLGLFATGLGFLAFRRRQQQLG